MEVFRLSRARYADQLSGFGAALKGARWNSRGVELIYTAENRSLAMAEVLVHLSLAMLPRDFMMLTIFIPNEIEVFNLPLSQLSDGWNSFPHKRITQELGDLFIHEKRYAVMRVPSVVTQGDFNILINPGHTLFKEISIVRSEPFPFDRRIFK
ncbi:MAG: RES family NAD+ phosphorylase [Bacteroidales bacterium]|nr:RES family NAD+ phosphorylase [Bacteroidales bacterium]HOI31845.1 RES family NAD+ phosphorylase [Bacteroidales bacterium]